ncbi:MAG: hypothetical protein EOP84_31865, partial [Verrucomicrobiaceae bacterium]
RRTRGIEERRVRSALREHRPGVLDVDEAQHRLEPARAERESAVLTFTATASGLTLFGIGPAFWGLIVGFLAMGVRRFCARTLT